MKQPPDYRIIILCAAAGLAAGYALQDIYTMPSDGMTASRLLEGASPILGSADAPLTMIEWGDYQCTYCYRFHQGTFDMIKRDYVETGMVKVVFRDFPLNGPDSVLAAQASQCADEQGLYWEYHDTLYNNWGGERTGWIDNNSLYGFALEAGLRTSTFAECMDSGRYLGSIYGEYSYSQQLGIDATPSFMIHDGERAIRIVGNQPPGVFVSALEGFGG